MKSILGIFCFFLIGSGLWGQQIQSPSEFLGYPLGSQFTWHHRVVDYYNYIAEVSPLVQTETYGETYEGRPLLIAIVSAEENLKQLEALKKANLTETGFLEGESEVSQIPFVWLGYNIHGNESVGTEAALRTLYVLATKKRKEVDSWLKDMVILIDPCQNPDGRDLYTYRYRRSQGLTYNANPDAEEHHQQGLSARANHYSFDMNRDWTWQTQQETRMKIAKYQEFMPHVHADFHEMGSSSTFFFAPGAEPWHEAITPWQREFHKHMGEGNAKLFDEANRLYFTKESFDLFCPSFGDTWPLFNGAMGFTYEQGGGGFAGVAVKRKTDDTLSLVKRIDNHFNASMATLQVSWEQRERLISEFNTFFRKGMENPIGDYKSVIIPASNPAADVASLFELLDHNKIQYSYANAKGKKVNGFNYRSRKNEEYTIQDGDYLISYYQPQSHFVKVLFEPESFSKDSMTYDLSAWALPYAYNLEAWAVKERIKGKDDKVVFTSASEEIEPAYAWVSEWKSFQDARFLADALDHKIRIRYANEPFSLDGKKFDRGSLVITQEDNSPLGESFVPLLQEVAKKHQQVLIPVSTGLVEKGKDLGSNTMSVMYKPEIAMVTGDVTSSYATGEMWYFFEQELDYPLTRINSSSLSSVQLFDYDVLILTSGSYNRYEEVITDYIRQGGKVIALERAVNLFAGEKSGTALAKATKKRAEEDKKTEKKEELSTSDPKNLVPHKNRRRTYLSDRPASCIYRVWLDETHPYAYGIGDEWFVLKRSSSILPYLQGSGTNVAALKEGDPVSGFAGYKFRQKVGNSLFIGSERMGSGEVIYVADSPYYRAFWKGGRLLLSNLIFH